MSTFDVRFGDALMVDQMICRKQQPQQLERGEFGACLSPSGLDSRESFDLPIGKQKIKLSPFFPFLPRCRTVKRFKLVYLYCTQEQGCFTVLKKCC